jgi:hypothetical protein
MRLPLHLIETSARGFWNSLRVSQRAGSGTLIIVKPLSDAAGDPERFFAHLAVDASKNRRYREIDLLFLENNACPLTVYSAIARMFGRRSNLQLLHDPQALRDVVETTTSTQVVEAVDELNRCPILLSDAILGTLELPALSKNIAREHLKTIDATGRFCAISLRAGTHALEMTTAIALAGERHAHWYFIILNDVWCLESCEATAKIFVAARAGFDVLTRLCIAAEADAYVGVDDMYGLAAALSGKPAHLLRDARLSVDIPIQLSNATHSTEYSSAVLSRGIDRVLSESVAGE